MAAPHPRASRLSHAIHQALPPREGGFGVLGILVTLALSTAVVGVAYTAYVHNRRTSQVLEATDSTRAITQRVLSSYAGSATFNGLTTTKALSDGLFPPGVMKNGVPTHVWGGSIQLSSINLPGPTGPGDENGFALTFDNVDPDTCASFAVNAGRGFYDVRINGTSAMEGRQVPVASATLLCNQNTTPTVQFVQAKVSPKGAQLAALDPCVPQPPQYQNVACPAGQISSVPPYGPDGITQQRTSFCNMAYGPVGWSPWAPYSSTCAPICTAPPNTTQSQSQSTSCPSGQVTASGAGSFTQTQTRAINYSCPAPTGAYSTNYGAWSTWTPTVAATCAPACVAPATSSVTQTQSTACPTGQVTPAGASTFTQSRTATTTYSCPAPTGAYSSGTSYTVWSPSGTTACDPKCVAPANTTQTQTLSCPSGQTGSITQKRSVTYSCPAPTGSYSTSYGAWSTTSNTCTPTATWGWNRDAANTYYNYEPSTPGNAPNVQYSGAYKAPTYPGCYTCWPVSNMDYTTCQVSVMMGNCKCDAGNAGAEFLEQWSDAGNGVGQNAYVCSQS